MPETEWVPKSAPGKDVASRSVRDTPTSSGPLPPPSSPPGSTGRASPSGFIMGTINSAIALVKNPVSYITSNKDSTATVRDIMVNYVAVLAAIPFLATLIGYLWYYDLFIPRGFVGSFVAYAFLYAFLFYILDVVAVYVVALAIGFLAPTFGSSNDKIKSLRLSAFIFTPAFLIGVLNIIPFLGVLEILGILYGLYILYLGLPILMGTPKDRVVTYVVAVVIATFIVYFVLDAIVGVVTAAAFHVAFGLM